MCTLLSTVIMQTLRNHITKLAPLTEKEWQAFTAILQPLTLIKRQTFLNAGSICYSSAFVVTGLFKVYTTDTQGNEKIIQFNREHTFLSDCESYLHKKPSDYSIEAVEDATIIVFKNTDLEKLCQTHSVFEKIGRQITHGILAYHKEHLKLLLTMAPAERYAYIVAHHPYLLQRVSVTHLAQFIGLTRETVSRLRGKIVEQQFK